jgi:hypothetical protein
MAKYEEYAEKHDDTLQSEIDDAATQAQDRKENPESFELPERYQGKTVEEIAQMHMNVEQKLSSQGNDLGELRRTVDTFMELQSQSTPEPETPKAEPVTVDDLYDDPDAAVRRVVDEAMSPSADKIAELEAALQVERYNAQLTSLDGKYEGWRVDAGSQEFIDWVQASPARMRIANMAEQRDLSAADDLMGLWYETNGVQGQLADAQRDEQLRNASLESGGPVQTPGVDTFGRADLMNHRIAAKRGDVDSIAYLKSNAEAIAIAYEEGHITD